MWALENSDIPEELNIREKSKFPKCIGVFLLFTTKRLMWVIKEKGQSWNGEYFRNTVLAEHVIPFLNDKRNVLSVQDTTFLHDRAPCMSALATQNMLKANKIDYFGNGEWPGSSPDLNACENLGSILKGRVENRLSETGDDLRQVLLDVLQELEFDQELFTSLLTSYPTRINAIRAAKGGHTKY